MKKILWLLLLTAGWLAAAWQTSPLRPNGTIDKWLIAGPFPNGHSGAHDRNCTGYFTDYLVGQGGESRVLAAEGDSIKNSAQAAVVWMRTASDASGLLDFIDNLAVDSQTPYVVYASCQLLSGLEQQASFRIRSNDGVRFWLNGQLIHDHHIGRRVDAEEDRLIATLRKGENTLLFKVDTGGAGWGLQVALTHVDGSPITQVTSRISTNPALSGKILSASFATQSVVMRTSQGDRQIMTGLIKSNGLRQARCILRKPGWPKPQQFNIGDVTPGVFRFEMKIPPFEEDAPVTVELTSAQDRKVFDQVLFKKIRPWFIHLVQHTHTDIGYTRPQNEMLAEYFRYLDWALDFCDQTDSYPDDARFRWTCETAWVVREYLHSRPPQQISRLLKRAQEGRIEVSGMLLNWSELADESTLAASLQSISEFRKLGLPVVSAMQNDVNGAAWCLVDFFSGCGIKYLSMGINHDHAALQFSRPTPFWWESPSAQRILAFQADHYMAANAFINTNGNLDLTKKAVSAYVESLENREYPYNRIAVQFSGYDTDNSPPAVNGCDLVKKWNEAYAWPRLRLATVKEYLQLMEQEQGSQLPVYRAAWPDWWTDGAASAARESGAVRSVQAGLLAAQGALALAKICGADPSLAIDANLKAVQEAALYYDEHTFGASESITDPDAANSMVQWQQKSSYAWQAVRESGVVQEQALGALQSYLPRTEVPSLAVINTLNWQRSGLVQVFIDKEILAADQQALFVDADGLAAASQAAGSRAEGSYWQIWAKDVPAMGYKIYRIEKKSPAPALASPSLLLENEWYRLAVDAASGAVSSLYDKELEYEWVEAKGPWQMAQWIHEQVADRSKFSSGAFLRTGLRNVRVAPGPASPLWQSLSISAEGDGCAAADPEGRFHGVTLEIRLYRTEKRIEFHFAVRKQAVTTPEAIYVAFPFSLNHAQIRYEAQGGLVSPGENQIPGSATDYQTVQNFVVVRGAEGQLIFGSDQAPMVMFSDLNYGKFQRLFTPTNPHIFSYVMSNYWHTNFPARQEGEIKWSYYLTTMKDTSNSAATRFGWGSRVPLLGRVQLPGPKPNAELARSLLHIGPENLLLVNSRPAIDGQGVVLHLREVEGKPAAVSLDQFLPGKKIAGEEVNVLEETLQQVEGQVVWTPWQTKFIKLRM